MSKFELGPSQRDAAPEGALPNPSFWRGRRVLVTGHTGFKGAWLSLWLQRLGAEVWGLALMPEDEERSLFRLARVGDGMTSRFVNLRNREGVARAVAEANPEITLHLAAQAIVRRALCDPTETWETNLLGTQHLLEALMEAPALAAALIVTSDKVYANDGSGRPHREGDPIGGVDPYAASKAACEILAASAARCYFEPRGVRIATARGGNVIGGGDFAQDRLAPDCVRAALGGAPVVLRQPQATRPWQHALDCLSGYLLYAERLVEDAHAPRTLNFGPAPKPAIPVVDFARSMMFALGAPDALELRPEEGSVEAPLLALDARLAQKTLGWRDRLVGHAAIKAAADWYRAWISGSNMRYATLGEIARYETECGAQGAAA